MEEEVELVGEGEKVIYPQGYIISYRVGWGATGSPKTLCPLHDLYDIIYILRIKSENEGIFAQINMQHMLGTAKANRQRVVIKRKKRGAV